MHPYVYFYCWKQSTFFTVHSGQTFHIRDWTSTRDILIFVDFAFYFYFFLFCTKTFRRKYTRPRTHMHTANFQTLSQFESVLDKLNVEHTKSEKLLSTSHAHPRRIFIVSICNAPNTCTYYIFACANYGIADRQCCTVHAISPDDIVLYAQIAQSV